MEHGPDSLTKKERKKERKNSPSRVDPQSSPGGYPFLKDYRTTGLLCRLQGTVATDDRSLDSYSYTGMFHRLRWGGKEGAKQQGVWKSRTVERGRGGKTQGHTGGQHCSTAARRPARCDRNGRLDESMNLAVANESA